ncbi:MAG: GspE/PulE family protein [Ilumatobacteraceae bacterium]
MALFTKTKEPAAPPAGADASVDPTIAVHGISAAECMQVGQLLVESNQLSPEALATSLQLANGDLLQFGDVALGRFGCGRQELSLAMSQVLGVPAADTKGMELDPEIVSLLDEKLIREHQVLPVALDGDTLIVLSADPSPHRRAAIEAIAGRPVRWFVGDTATVRTFIDRMHRADADVHRLVKSFDVPDDQQKGLAAAAEAASADDQAPVVQLVNRIVGQAMRDRASDIHVEPLDESLRIRFRIDGNLVVAFNLPLGVHAALTSRLKIMSGMNIVERRRPQDGQFSTIIDGKEVDVRVASVATVWGEKVVMRILDKGRSMIGLSELGFPRDTYNQYSKMVHAPFGMVICAGPTGAGKTTTLYATLQEINSTGKNVTTVEDPVEYVFPGINQIQTNEQAGLTFATGLKAILRQDPDVILVGEIRDAETARIAVQSALTGHFVLSSLHATDAASALHRFLDMGIEACLIAASVRGIVGQRLVRRVCRECAEPYEHSIEELAFYLDSEGPSDPKFMRGAGCNFCAQTGYHGRVGVYELLRVDEFVKELIVAKASHDEIRSIAVSGGMRTMRQEALALVADGSTTVLEVMRTIHVL